MLSFDIVIPAKAISQRCPNKNWRQLPLVNFKCCLASIALEQGCEIATLLSKYPERYQAQVNKIIVTTDQSLPPEWWWQHRLVNRVAACTLRYHLRPDRHPHYEEDTWVTVEAATKGSTADWVIVLQPTNPLRTIVGWDHLSQQIAAHPHASLITTTFIRKPLGTWYAAKLPIAANLAQRYKSALQGNSPDIVLCPATLGASGVATHYDIDTEKQLLDFCDYTKVQLDYTDLDPRKHGWLTFFASPNVIE